MNHRVKLGGRIHRLSFGTLLLIAGCLELSAAPREGKVALTKPSALPAGAVVREIREISTEGGTLKFTDTKEPKEEAVRYQHRLNWVRRVQGNDREQISVRDTGGECVFFVKSGAVPPPNTAPGPLQNTELRARRSAGRWEYELDKGTATPMQKQALTELGMLADLLSLVTLASSPQPRAKGESWKPSLSRPTGRAYGQVQAEEMECRLEDVIEIDGAAHVRLAISGKAKVERPLGYNGAMTFAFTGVTTRRLSDMLDVDTSLSGMLSYTGPVKILEEPATMVLEQPFTLQRMQKLEAR